MTNKKYILVAEDDATYANVYKLKLTKEGFETEVVANGEELLHSVAKRKPDLILLDIIMPVKSGLQTLEELRKHPANYDIKVVIMSNLGQEEDVKQAMSLGAIDYIVKTNLSIAEMIHRIKKHLSA